MHELESHELRLSYIDALERAERIFARVATAVEHYTIDDQEITCYVVGSGILPDTPSFAGGLGPRSVFLSDAIPRNLRYPVVVHEHFEIRQVLDQLGACRHSELLYAVRWAAHLRALGREASVVRELGIQDDYLRFRTSVYDGYIARVGGPHSRLGRAYAAQRGLFRQLCLQAHHP